MLGWVEQAARNGKDARRRSRTSFLRWSGSVHGRARPLGSNTTIDAVYIHRIHLERTRLQKNTTAVPLTRPSNSVKISLNSFLEAQSVMQNTVSNDS
jgi:hypothetical protein